MTHESRRVLILDDDRNMLKLLIAYLRAPGVELVACSEIEAAECLMDRERFDVLVTDLEVSDLGGREGLRLVRYVRCNFPMTQVVVFSGKINEQVCVQASALGVAELLEKPRGLSRLRDIVGADPLDRGPSVAEDCGKVAYVDTIEDLLASQGITALLQPIVSLKDPSLPFGVVGAEGLSRGPEGSPLRSPEVFLDYASRGQKLFETELQCIEAVLREGSCVSEIAALFINVRPRSLSSLEFAPQLCDLIGRYGFRANDVVLELTEQQSILDAPAFDSALDSLRRLGFGLALDDYGSGFANLHLLEQLNLDYVKIDGHFCQAIDADTSKQAIVGSTVEMAKRLGVATIMERVETEEELRVVQGLGVDYAQGYYFSRPIPGREFQDRFPPAGALGTRKDSAEPESLDVDRTVEGGLRVSGSCVN